MRKRVLICVPSLGTGGGERVALSIAEKVSSDKFDVLVLSLYAGKQSIFEIEAKQLGVEVKYLNKKLGWDFGVIGQVRKVIREFKPDVIHTHLYVVPYVMMAGFRKLPKYHTVHNVAEKEATGALRIFMRLAYKFWNFKPVAISPYCARTVEELYKIPANTVACVGNGVDVAQFYARTIPHDGIRIINVGRFEPQKNHVLLIKAFAALCKKYDDITLELVGEGYLREEIENLVKSLGIEGSVIMDGISNAVREKLWAADIYAMSSDYEGLPVAVLEAMACGLPIVATDAGGTVDIVKDGENGALVPVGDVGAFEDALERMILDEKMRKRCAEVSVQMAQAWSIEQCISGYERLYMT